MTNFKKITIILIITTLIVLCLANTAMAKEYKGKLKYNKYTDESYYDFNIKKGKTEYHVHANYDFDNDYSEEGRWYISIDNQLKGSQDAYPEWKKGIIKKKGKTYVATKYKYDYKKQKVVLYNYKLVKKIIKKQPVKLKIKVKMTDFKYFSMKTKYKTYNVKLRSGFSQQTYYYHPKTKTLAYIKGTSFYLPRMYGLKSIII